MADLRRRVERITEGDTVIINYSTNLTEISLLLPPEAIWTKGIIAKITSELALNDVNVVGVMCCAPEEILLVTERDAPRALETLQRMLKEKSADAEDDTAEPKNVLTGRSTIP